MSEKENSNVPICCCLCFIAAFFLLILFRIGIPLWVTDNTRVDRINEYNYRAKQWVDQGMASFKKLTFRLNNETVFSENTERSGTFYPVRDSCNKKDDPQEQCVLTDALFYNATMSLSGDYANIIITNENSVIVDTQYPRVVKDILTSRALGCSDRDDEEQCAKTSCKKLHGKWKDWRCTVIWYLSNICFRVKDENGKWKLDKPPTWGLSKSNVGCYYNSGYNPVSYSTSVSDTIQVGVRYYKDSFISAEEMTRGCSSFDINSSSCFGMTNQSQRIHGLVVIIMSVFFLVLTLMFCFCLCFCWCRTCIIGYTRKPKKEIKNKIAVCVCLFIHYPS